MSDIVGSKLVSESESTLDTKLNLDTPLKDFLTIVGCVDMGKVIKVCSGVDFDGLSEKDCNWYIHRLKGRLEYIKSVEIHSAYRVERLLGGGDIFNDVAYFLKGDEYVKGEDSVLADLIKDACDKGRFNFSIIEVKMSMMKIEEKLKDRKRRFGI